MADVCIRPLPPLARRQLAAEQVVTDLVTVTKELVENALDARATSITVRLINHGLTALTVLDNGMGIAVADHALVAVRHATSKLTSAADLVGVRTLGFRGEALHALCRTSYRVQITTRTIGEPVATVLTVNRDGEVVCSARMPHPVGTAVFVEKPLYSTPVRRQMAERHPERHLPDIRNLLDVYAFAFPHVHLVLQTQATAVRGDRIPPWVRLPVPSTWAAVGRTVGRRAAETGLQHVTVERDGFGWELILPRADADNTPRGYPPYLYLNRRPMGSGFEPFRTFYRVVQRAYRPYRPPGVTLPFYWLNLTMPATGYEVNLEPAKDRALLADPAGPLALLNDVLAQVYPIKNEDKGPASTRGALACPLPGTAVDTEGHDLAPGRRILAQSARLEIPSVALAVAPAARVSPAQLRPHLVTQTAPSGDGARPASTRRLTQVISCPELGGTQRRAWLRRIQNRGACAPRWDLNALPSGRPRSVGRVPSARVQIWTAKGRLYVAQSPP